MKYYLVTYQWKTRRMTSPEVVNVGAATECMGQWWIEHLKTHREAVEEAQIRLGRPIDKIDWSHNDASSEEHTLLESQEITEEGYNALEEAEIGH